MMEFNLQIVLLIVGALIIAFVLWDSKRRKKPDTEKEPEVSFEELEDFYQKRDNSGYDVLGVGLSRVIGDDDSLVAQRDESVDVSDESLSASRDDATQEKSQPEQPDMIVSFTVIAKSEHGFNGEKLLHCMLSRGLRFGDMDIFHRHKHTSGEGPVQFSLANALKPGTFNLDDMNSFKTRAVTLFMMLPGPREPSNAFSLMLDTARHLASELDGQLLDDHKSVLTQQTIQHFQEQIIEYERKTRS